MKRTVIKYILRFLVQIARLGIKSILWVIRQFRRRNDKNSIDITPIQKTKVAQDLIEKEPEHFNRFHEATTRAKLAEIAEWKSSPQDSETVLKNQERFKKEAERMESEQYGSFDYTKLTKKELDKLYHQIIDKALENYEYRLHVLFTWKINHEEFNHRAARSLAIRIRREEERLKKHEIIGEYFDKRWAGITPEEAKADRQWILDQGRLRNPN